MAPSSDPSGSTHADWVLRTEHDARRALLQPGVILAGTTVLSIADDPLAIPRSERTARRLRFWQSVCGCQVAAFAFLGWILSAVSAAWPPARFDGWAVADTCGRALLAAIAAKCAAIVAARAILAIELLWLGCPGGPLHGRVERRP